MSRIAKKSLKIAEKVSITKVDDYLIISGPLGKLAILLGKDIELKLEGEGIAFNLIKNDHPGVLGSIYVHTRNAMKDVVDGYSVSVKMVGVGFKASIVKNYLRLFIGFSHDVVFKIPNNLTIKIIDDTNFTINGFCRNSVMKFAKFIRNIKKPEPYNCKGIFLNGETIIRKEGKKK